MVIWDLLPVGFEDAAAGSLVWRRIVFQMDIDDICMMSSRVIDWTLDPRCQLLDRSQPLPGGFPGGFWLSGCCLVAGVEEVVPWQRKGRWGWWKPGQPRRHPRIPARWLGEENKLKPTCPDWASWCQ